MAAKRSWEGSGAPRRSCHAIRNRDRMQISVDIASNFAYKTSTPIVAVSSSKLNPARLLT
jgi:hypothetical protein